MPTRSSTPRPLISILRDLLNAHPTHPKVHTEAAWAPRAPWAAGPARAAARLEPLLPELQGATRHARMHISLLLQMLLLP